LHRESLPATGESVWQASTIKGDSREKKTWKKKTHGEKREWFVKGPQQQTAKKIAKKSKSGEKGGIRKKRKYFGSTKKNILPSSN